MKIAYLVLPLVAALVLSGCRYDSPPVVISLNSAFSQQTIPAKSRNVIVQPGLAMDEIKASVVTGKLFVNGKEFALTGTGNNPVQYISAEPCLDFGSGVQDFRYQLFKGSTLYKEDTAKVKVVCS